MMLIQLNDISTHCYIVYALVVPTRVQFLANATTKMCEFKFTTTKSSHVTRILIEKHKENMVAAKFALCVLILFLYAT